MSVIRIVCWMPVLATFALFSRSDVCAAEEPALHLEEISIPGYPYLARLSGIEGTVHFRVTLNADCSLSKAVVVDGPKILSDELLRTVFSALSDKPQLRFQSCSRQSTTDVLFTFIFSLKGQPTNGWDGTEVHVSSLAGSTYRVEITTAPGDLNILGLTKKKPQK